MSTERQMKKPYSPPVFRTLDPDDELVTRCEADDFTIAVRALVSTEHLRGRLTEEDIVNGVANRRARP